MGQYLLLQKNSRVFMLVKYADRYHIIAVNNNLDEQAEQTILNGNCSEAVLDQMGLSRETIMKKDLRGIAIGGHCAGDVIVLYPKGKKLKYVLSDDCEAETIDTLFTDIARFQPPKSSDSKAKKTDWRVALQNESKQRIMGPIGIILDYVGFGVFVGSSVYGRLHNTWSIISLLILVVSMATYLTHPQYFSIIGSKAYQRVGYTAKVKHLNCAIAGPALALTLRSFYDFSFPNWMSLFIAGAVIGIVVSIILYAFSREVRENLSVAISVLLLTILLSCGIVGQLNHLANPDVNEPQICTVIHTKAEDNGKHIDQFYCSIALVSGAEMELPISRSIYNRLQVGDQVRIFTDHGAFGIEYAYFVDIK